MNLALWNPPFISLKLCESQARQPGHHRLLPCSNIYPILVWVHGHIDQYMVKHEVLVSILVLSIEMLHMGIKEWNEEIKMNQSMDDWRLTFLFIVKMYIDTSSLYNCNLPVDCDIFCLMSCTKHCMITFYFVE